MSQPSQVNALADAKGKRSKRTDAWDEAARQSSVCRGAKVWDEDRDRSMAGQSVVAEKETKKKTFEYFSSVCRVAGSAGAKSSFLPKVPGIVKAAYSLSGGAQQVRDMKKHHCWYVCVCMCMCDWQGKWKKDKINLLFVNQWGSETNDSSGKPSYAGKNISVTSDLLFSLQTRHTRLKVSEILWNYLTYPSGKRPI